MGVGLCSMCCRLGAIVAPYIASLKNICWWLPPLIFGVIPLLGAALCLVLPETVDCKLPDTIEETEAAERERKAKKTRKDGPSTSN